MPNSISPARQAAHHVLLELRRKPETHSDTMLRSRRVEALSALDKNLATTLVMGVLRWQLVLQERIRGSLTKSKSHLGDPVQVALELGALQLLLLDRIPARAAIFESVELVRQSGNGYAVGLVNAVLRKVAPGEKLKDSEAMEAHPRWLVDRWKAFYSETVADTICRYDQLPPPTTIRLGDSGIPEGIEVEPGDFVTAARRVIRLEPSARSALRIQDEGSQLIAELAGQGSIILDCCAAPGGKAAILAERNPSASITACDVSPGRLQAMQSQFGSARMNYRVLDATELPFAQEFDLVLCDAPCSGTGTLARNPEIRHRITAEDFARQQERQIRLLCSAMRTVRKGGRVVYSTCSLEPEENEQVVMQALELERGFRLVPWRDQVRAREAKGILNPGTTDRLFPDASGDEFLHTFPGAYQGDGFFAACLNRD